MTGPTTTISLKIASVVAGTVFIGIAGAACWINYADPKPIDFLSYWAAGRMAIDGQAAMAYDIAAHHAVEMTAAPIRGLQPFPYPVPFLLVVAPFGLLPFQLAFPVWLLTTGMLYFFVARRVVPASAAAAHPSVLANGLIGQNGFLTSAIFLYGVGELERRPWLAGAVLGLIVIKPQLALLIPVALVAGGAWRAIGGAALSSAALLLVAFLLFGGSAYQSFFAILPHYSAFMAASRWPWSELASVFALARFFSVATGAALAIQGAAAAFAAFMVFRSWRLGFDGKMPILAAATLLVPPYLFTYDALLLVVPIGWWMRDQRRPYLIAVIWILCLLPVAGYFDLYRGPNTIPIAAMISLWALYSDQKRNCEPQSRERNPAY